MFVSICVHVCEYVCVCVCVYMLREISARFAWMLLLFSFDQMGLDQIAAKGVWFALL